MADESTVDEKAMLNETEDDPTFNDSKAKFIANGGDHKVAVETSSSEVSFTGLGKDELLKYANDPFWKRVRLILFIIFWIGWLGMLVAAIVIIVLAPKCPYKPDMKWFDKQATYQIYPKSFKDTNKPDKAAPGEGVGDLQGIISELEDGGYFSEIGVETLYINSFYKSGGVDNGMDVVDYLDVEKSLGTMAEFDRLRKLTKDKMRLVLDFIPNHTSRNHTWFMKSQQKDGDYTDYYVWAPCTKGGAKPNNWMNVYGGSAWTYDDVRNECYLHNFLEEEPDLNLMNDKVRTEMRNVLQFWLGKGVDGFYVRHAEYLVNNNKTDEDEPSSSGTGYDSLEHIHTKHQPGTFELLQEWRSILDEKANKPGKEKALIVTVDADVNTTMKYYSTEGKKGATIVRMPLLKTTSVANLATHIKDRILEVSVDDANKKIWMLGNEDTSRITSTLGEDYMKAVLAVQMLLPGTSSSYYGDEIAMKNGAAAGQDPVGNLSGQTSRDAYRTPMQWSSGQNAGFSQFSPWLPVGSNYKTNNVEQSRAYHSENSIIHSFKALVKLGEEESFQFGKTDIMTLKDNSDILWMTRKAEGFTGYLVIVNLGDTPFSSSFYKEAKIPHNVMQVFHSDGALIKEKMDLSKRAISIEPKHVHVYSF